RVVAASSPVGQAMYAVGRAAYVAGLLERRRADGDAPKRGTRRQREAAARPPPIARREFLRGGAVAPATLGLSAGARSLAGPAAVRRRIALPTTRPSSRGPAGVWGRPDRVRQPMVA